MQMNNSLRQIPSVTESLELDETAHDNLLPSPRSNAFPLDAGLASTRKPHYRYLARVIFIKGRRFWCTRVDRRGNGSVSRHVPETVGISNSKVVETFPHRTVLPDREVGLAAFDVERAAV